MCSFYVETLNLKLEDRKKKKNLMFITLYSLSFSRYQNLLKNVVIGIPVMAQWVNDMMLSL